MPKTVLNTENKSIFKYSRPKGQFTQSAGLFFFGLKNARHARAMGWGKRKISRDAFFFHLTDFNLKHRIFKTSCRARLRCKRRKSNGYKRPSSAHLHRKTLEKYWNGKTRSM